MTSLSHSNLTASVAVKSVRWRGVPDETVNFTHVLVRSYLAVGCMTVEMKAETKIGGLMPVSVSRGHVSRIQSWDLARVCLSIYLFCLLNHALQEISRNAFLIRTKAWQVLPPAHESSRNVIRIPRAPNFLFRPASILGRQSAYRDKARRELVQQCQRYSLEKAPDLQPLLDSE